MCFFSPPKTPTPPPPAAAPDANSRAPVLANSYETSTPESGIAAERGATMARARGTSQLRVDLDPTLAGMDNSTGLQINN